MRSGSEGPACARRDWPVLLMPGSFYRAKTRVKGARCVRVAHAMSLRATSSVIFPARSSAPIRDGAVCSDLSARRTQSSRMVQAKRGDVPQTGGQLFNGFVVPPPPRDPGLRKPKVGKKPGEKRRRREMSASLAGAKDLGAVLLAAVVLVVIVVIVVTLSSLWG
jgi:hypothetical protein